MAKKQNLDIREEVKRAGLCLWQIAEGVGLSESRFVCKLRHELPDEEKARIREVIAELHEGAEA